ncbi:MAG TPA: glycosyltransferase [Bacteroidota bacterium]|nr:glycosyltransferase [Bacteroidota bacterium]
MLSLVMTCRNERKTIPDFVEGVQSQIEKPDEIIIVDGGSTDGTAEYLQSVIWGEQIRSKIIVRPDCQIRYTPSPVAKARNVAITEASGDWIAVTDAGCRLRSDWLSQLVMTGKGHHADIISGRTLAAGRANFAAVLVKKQPVNDPSSRCIMFRKSVWEKVGGYPEIVLTAEDSGFNAKLRNIGCVFVDSPSAFVVWEMPTTWRDFLKKVYRYGKGDGYCSIHLSMYITKMVKWLFIPVGIVLSIRKHGFTMAVADFARIAGFVVGLWDKAFGSVRR